MIVHPPYADLVERAARKDVAEHLAICAPCRVRARIAAEVLRASPADLPRLDEARDRMARARIEASNSSALLSLDDLTEELELGRQLERYTVERRLGSGGMGTVYLVRHTVLGSSHALKVLHRISASVRQRLIREGRAQSSLKHPNVLAVTDVVTVDGAPGLIIEHVEGPSLADLLREGPLDLQTADAIAQGILLGVAAAHRAGIVHRDLKPANVLLVPTEDGFLPKVSDFGLAKQLESGDPQLTRSEGPMGTPSYMAPEQIRDASRADARSDIFSLGAILYELVTGQRAFDGLDPITIYEQIRSGSYEPADRIHAGLPPHMGRTIRKALERDPDDRFADCDALLQAWRGEKAVPRRPLNRGPIVASATTVAGLIGMGLLFFFWSPAPPALPVDPPVVVPLTEYQLTARPSGSLISAITLSPDGEEVAYTDHQGLWLQPAQRGEARLIAEGRFGTLDYLPDGSGLIAFAMQDGKHGLVEVDRSGEITWLQERQGQHMAVSPDGERVALVDRTGLWVIPLRGGAGARLLALGPKDATGAIAWSPSGDYIAGIYESVSRPGAWLEITAADASSSRKVLEAAEIIHIGGSTLEWLPGDTLVYGFIHERAQPHMVSLRAVQNAEVATDRDFAEAPVVHRWTGLLPTRLSASRDGRLAYLALRPDKEAWLIPLDDQGEPGEPWLHSQEGWGEAPTAWLPDGRLVLISDRAARKGTGRTDRSGDIYAQGLEGGKPERLAMGPVPDHGARVVGDSLVFTRLLMGAEGLSQGQAIYTKRDGEPEEEIYRYEATGNANFQFQLRCVESTARCMVSEPMGTSARFKWLDLETGEVTSTGVAAEFNWWAWDVSPDGRTLAVFRPKLAVFHDLENGGHTEQSVNMRVPHYAAWNPDGSGVYLTGVSWPEDSGGNPDRVIEVRPGEGDRVVWSTRAALIFAPTPSPDGRTLAMGVNAFENDLWVLDTVGQTSG